MGRTLALFKELWSGRPIGAGTLANHLGEAVAKVAVARKANPLRNGRDGHLALSEQLLRARDSISQQVVMGRGLELLSEESNKLRGTH